MKIEKLIEKFQHVSTPEELKRDEMLAAYDAERDAWGIQMLQRGYLG